MFAKLEFYNRHRRRRTHGHATSAGVQITADGDDVGCSTSGPKYIIFVALANHMQDDGYPYVLDLRDLSKNVSSANGGGGQADQIARQSSPITDGQAQDKSPAQRNLDSNTIEDQPYADIPKAREAFQDEEYEPSARLSDEPRRLPTTRKEIERRQNLPLSQRSRESTLDPHGGSCPLRQQKETQPGPDDQKEPWYSREIGNRRWKFRGNDLCVPSTKPDDEL